MNMYKICVKKSLCGQINKRQKKYHRILIFNNVIYKN